MNVNIFAASDRNNYGDLIFPLILHNYYKSNLKDVTITNYSVYDSDLSHFGALKTRSLSKLIKEQKDYDLLIVAGGEVLGSGWLNILRFSNKFWNFLHSSRLIRALINRTSLLDYYYKTFKSSCSPFIFEGEKFKKIKIIYNSVGALAIKKKLENKEIEDYFRKVALLSVRDESSFSKFESKNIQVKKVPCCALLMNELLSKNIPTSVSSECLNYVENNKYIFLQVGYNVGPDDLNLFVDDVRRFADSNNLKVILCPIGLAMGHDDNKILSRISKLESKFHYYMPKNLYEIMYLIKNCSLYMGSSLHGFITAQSFYKPYFVFDKKVCKSEQYILTWMPELQDSFGGYNDFDKIQRRFNNFNIEEETKNTNLQKQKVVEHLKNIVNYV